MPAGCIALIIFMCLIFLMPLFFADAMLAALGKLGFTPEASFFLCVWIFFGGFVNIPIKRIERREVMDISRVSFFGLDRIIPKTYRRSYTIIAVNLGGCVIPCFIVSYEFMILSRFGLYAVAASLFSAAVNVFLCYKYARPIPNIGISLPPLVPALSAILCAWIFLPDIAPPAAFVSGVLGPLIGADLLHLKDIEKNSTGIGSIGGAGTFDGIVLAGMFATLLA